MIKRGCRPCFIIAFLGALSFAALAHGSCPLMTHDDSNEQREFQNVCQNITNPTIQTATISTATINSLSMNSHKITNLANGTASTDAAAFGQIPSAVTLTDPATYTPTVGGINSTSGVFLYTHYGKMLHMWGAFLEGSTPAASAAYITVPSGLTIDVAKTTAGGPLGIASEIITGSVSNALNCVMFSDASDTSKMFMAKSSTAGSLFASQNGSSIWNGNNYVYFNAWVPLTN